MIDIADLDVIFLSYNEPKLTSYGEWWKQLFGESEGKKNLGLYPSSMLYSTDLHSLGQYMQEGFPSVMQTFLFFEKPQINKTSINMNVNHSGTVAVGITITKSNFKPIRPTAIYPAISNLTNSSNHLIKSPDVNLSARTPIKAPVKTRRN